MKQIYVVVAGDDEYSAVVKAFISKSAAVEFSESPDATKVGDSYWEADASTWVVEIELVE